MRYACRFLPVVVALLGATALAQSFRTVELPDVTERVTGIHCVSAAACVVSTDGTSGFGRIYATDGTSITRTLVVGDTAFAEGLGTLGTVDFLGFTATGDRVIAHVAGARNAFVTATGDITSAESWTGGLLGLADGATRGGNQQIGFGTNDGRWVMFGRSMLFETRDPPGPGALWTPLWSPQSPGEVPSNFRDLYRADPSLCSAEPGVGISPPLTQPGYVAPDLSIAVYPAGARNQLGDAGPGVCVSTDAGTTFHHVPFPDVEGDLGPVGVGCATPDHCFAYGGVASAPSSTYIYVSFDAQRGPASTWQRSTLPSLPEGSGFRGVAFDPGGTAGWAVGYGGAGGPLMLVTSDGGTSWTDATSEIRGLALASRLHTVYVLDGAHVWIGGENGILLTNTAE